MKRVVLTVALSLGLVVACATGHGSGRFPETIDAARKAPASAPEAKALAAKFAENGGDDDIEVVMPLLDAAARAHPEDFELKRLRGRALWKQSRLDYLLDRKEELKRHQREAVDVLLTCLETSPDLEVLLEIDHPLGDDPSYSKRSAPVCAQLRKTLTDPVDIYWWSEGCLTAGHSGLGVGLEDDLTEAYVAEQTKAVNAVIPTASNADVLIYLKGRQNKGTARRAMVEETMRTFNGKSCRDDCFRHHTDCAGHGEYERPGLRCQEAQYQCLGCCAKDGTRPSGCWP